MKEAILNFFRLQVQNVIEPVYWALAFAWIGLLVVSLHSIWSRSTIGFIAKSLWSVTILALPLIGLFLYVFYSLSVADYSALERFGLFKKGIKP